MKITLEEAKLLTRTQRYRLRKKGVIVPAIPARSGFTQSAEHIEKRKRFGPSHHAWLGDSVSEKGGRTRALRAYPDIGCCVRCGSQRSERHHRDGNTANNSPENVVALCRKCHMSEDGRLDKFMELACKKK